MSTARPDLSTAAFRGLLGASVVVGTCVTALIIWFTNASVTAGSVRLLLRSEPALLLGGATLINLAFRFVRWQYFLRRVAIRRSTRESLLIYLAALGVSFVPLFAGEIALKGHFIGAGDQRAQRTGWTVALYERLCDVVAISLLAALVGLSPRRGSVAGGLWWLFLLPPAAFATRRGRSMAVEAAGLAVRFVDRLLRGTTLQDDPRHTASLLTARRALVGVGLGLAAWGVVCAAAVFVVYFSAGPSIGWQAGPLFAAATLIGGLSLSPGGAGVTGLVFGHGMIELGVQVAPAFAAVVAVRALTFWLALGIGQVALAFMALRRRERREHFDAVSPVYDAQIPVHIRERLVGRKVRFMLAALPPVRGLRGLDIGCGLGWYASALRVEGATVRGIDLSLAQARAARQTGTEVVLATAPVLPFQCETFDFAYAVNVVHHLGDREQQGRVLAEVARVLKPGGQFFLHEINTTNPVFRFYMGYIFPLVRRIDEGTELWLNPDALPVADGLAVNGVKFFTFLPDFLPRVLLRWMVPMEARLEASRWSRYSAHFMATYQKRHPSSSREPLR